MMLCQALGADSGLIKYARLLVVSEGNH